jgi:hypothetical protein
MGHVALLPLRRKHAVEFFTENSEASAGFETTILGTIAQQVTH